MKPALRAKAAALIVELSLAVIGIVLLSGVGLYLALPAKPFESRLGRQLAEAVLSNAFDGAPVRFDQLLLQKGSLSDPIHVEASQMRVYATRADSDHEAAKPVLTASNVKLDISIPDIVTGRNAISLLEISDLVLAARRDETGHFRFELTSAPGKGHAQSAPIKPLSVMNRIQTLRVQDAKLVFDDALTGKTEEMAVLDIDRHRDSAFKQDLVIVSGRDPAQQNRSMFDFVLSTTDHEPDAEMMLYLHELPLGHLVPFVPQLASRIVEANGALTGNMRLLYNKKTGVTTGFQTSMQAASGSVLLNGTSDKSIDFKNLNFNWDDTGGKLMGDLQDRALDIAMAKNADGHYDLTAIVPEIRAEDVAPFFPADASGVAHEWLTTKLSEGSLKNVTFTGMIAQDKKTKGWALTHPKATFATENLKVIYKLHMSPARNLNAHGVFENDTLTLDIQNGMVESLNILEGQLKFEELTQIGRGKCVGNVRLQGPLQGVLAYLDNPITHYKDRVSVDLSKASGTLQMTVALDFPTTKNAKTENIKVNVDAILRDASLPDIVKGVTIGGGPLAVRGDPSHVRIFGDARINGAPADLDYESYFSKINTPFVQKLHVKTQITGDMVNSIDDGWGDAIKTPSTATLDFQQPIQGTPVVSLLINGSDLSVGKAALNLTSAGGFESGTFDNLVLGQTSGDLGIAHNKDGGQSVTFKGPRLDVRPILNDKRKGGKKPANLNVDVDATTLITSDDAALQNGKLSMATNGQGDMARFKLTGRAGQGDVLVDFSGGPQGDTLNASAQDAGALLAAMGASKGVNGGVLQIQGRPNGAYGSMTGRARIVNFTARDVPALGRLINALSLPGLFNLFTSEGIAFEKLRADFTWDARKDGSVLTLSNGSTSGSSLGLTFGGTYNHGSKTINLAGEIVPLSGINGLIKDIPLIGTILSGGKNSSLVAANYKMRGPLKEPEVSINPLSVLAPGLLRTILFENGPETEE